ncbi:chromosome segregation protein SMC [bacterium]|nr:chromosome segregation protein SMC [bacterium]
MYLSRLEIFGFKTFAQKVDLHFDDGITNIVGPNGCGKSNIVDALRWSLGEQKSSVLRSEKMENVIFNGTKGRKPLNLAEVSLTIQNTKNILPTEYTEVTLTRRIYRSGESEYFLNRLPCRLKDINDLFMDTGMGADAYSVIELKMVEQILSDNTEDRRKLFEEAAGITKYKIRRRQTFRKLDATKADLMRANDIIAEIEKKVNSLRRQTQKANRYNKLMSRLKIEDVRLGHHEFTRLSELIQPLENKLAGLESSAEQILGEVSKKESEVEALNAILIGKEQKLRETQIELENQDKQIKAIEEKILISRERNSSLLDLIRRYSEEKTASLEKKEILHRRIDELSAAIGNLESRYAESKENLSSKKADFEGFDESITSKKNDLEKNRKELVQLIDEVAKKRSAYQLTKNNIQNLERKIDDLKKDNAVYSSTSDDALSVLDDTQYEKRKLADTIDLLKKDIISGQQQIDALRISIDESRSLKLHAEADVRSIHSRIAIIQKAIESHEGFPEGVQYLLQEKLAGIDTTIADIISVDEDYKRATEAALGDSFSFLVSGKIDSIRNALSKLTESRKGVATFLNMEKLSQFRSSVDLHALNGIKNEIIGFATELVKSDDPRLMQLLLGDVVFVDQFEKAINLADRFPQFRFVTLAGEIIKGNYLIKGGSRAQTNDTIIGQREALRRLQDQVIQLEKQVVELQTKITVLEGQLRETTAKLAADQEKQKSSEQQLLSLDKDISQSEYEQKRSRETLVKNQDIIDQTTRELEIFQTHLEEMGPHMDELELRRGELELQTRKLELQLNDLEKERKDRSESVNEVFSSFVRLESEIKTHQTNVENSRQQIQDIDTTIAKHESETVAAQQEIEKLEESAVVRESELIAISKKRDAIEKDRDIEGSEVSNLRESAGKIEAELKKIRRQREELLNSRHTMEQEHNDLRFEMRSLTERIQRDYDFDLSKDSVDSLFASVESKEEAEYSEMEEVSPGTLSAENDRTEKNLDEVLDTDLPQETPASSGFDSLAVKTMIDELRRKIKQLGPVNMEAFAEYNVEKDRLDTLTQQRQDLLEAESQLMQTIETINTTAQKQFMEVFDRIKENFINIFTSLFESSEANLELAKEEDPLEANIEILARPTGKKIQHIALLSGGEKTLTAIALLFAIYLVKPSPFCILDEVDAPLDDTNIDKFTKILRDFSKDTQFIVVTHNKRTMEAAQNIFGITMQEAGVSKVVSVKFNDRDIQSDDIEEIIRQNQVEELTHEVKEPPSGTPAEN